MTHQRANPDLFEPVRPERAVDTVIEEVLELIRTGQLRNGQLLPSERRLATAMRVSRRTIRDAIEALQDAGVVTVELGASGGARVASIWIPEQLSTELVPRGAEEVFTALEARRVVEPRVAQLAALRGRDDDFTAMRDTIELQRTHQQDWWQITQSNVLFHRHLWRAARNRDLEITMRAIYRKLSAPLYQILKEDQDLKSTNESIDLHVETLDAIERGRPHEVDTVMDRHLQYLEHRCELIYNRARFADIPPFLLGSTTTPSQRARYPR